MSQHVLFLNVPFDDCLPHLSADTIPGVLFAAFQMMFALMVPVIVVSFYMAWHGMACMSDTCCLVGCGTHARARV